MINCVSINLKKDQRKLVDDGVLKIEKLYEEENELKKSTIDDLKKC